MSTWQDIDLSGVSTELELLPEGPQTFSLLSGAKYGKFNAGKIELGARVEEGEYKGKVQYFSYNDPEKVPSMVQALKRLEEALVADGAPSIEEGQDPVSYLNQLEVVGKRFVAPVRHRTYKNQEDVDVTKSDIGIYKVKAVA